MVRLANGALVSAESKLSSQKQQLAEITKQQKSAEWDLEDLQSKSDLVNKKLYGGTVKNPKELANLEQELKILKSQSGKKEDVLLGLMSQVEDLQANVNTSAKELEQMKQEWQKESATLNQRKIEIETQLARLDKDYQQLVQQIEPETLALYEQIKLRRGQAIAKVEQGRCQGCHITLPISQGQKAKAGKLVQCNSCTRILYVE